VNIENKDKIKAQVVQICHSENCIVVTMRGRFEEKINQDLITSCFLYYFSKKEKEKIERIISLNEDIVVYRHRIASTEAWEFKYLVNEKVGEYLILTSGYHVN
jgi:hypothetical protein